MFVKAEVMFKFERLDHMYFVRMAMSMRVKELLSWNIWKKL